MQYTIPDIAAIIGARWQQQAGSATISHLLIDSRKLLFPQSTVFFALKTESRNGHQFIGRLYQQGVRCFVVSEEMDPKTFPGASLLLVENTFAALQTLAAAHRKKFSYPVIGITGSNGKTIVKEWLNQLLEEDHNIVRSPRSYNSQIGVPLSVWQMESLHSLGIFEAGISRIGEMLALQNIIQPTIGILTNIGAAHNEGFSSLRQKLEEKWKLFHSARVIIYKRDHGLTDEYVKEIKRDDCLYFSWSFEGDATMQVSRTAADDNGVDCTIMYNDQNFALRIPFTDEASIENALTCCACLLYMDLPADLIIKRIAQLHSVGMRLEMKEGINHCSVINDSYSADLSSLIIALDFLAQQKQHLTKTVILSDIPETGMPEEELYQRVAMLLQHHGVKRLFAIGPRISAHKAVFESAALEVHSYPETASFIAHAPEIHFRDETILIKGARRFSFEDISALLEMQVHQTVLEINLNAMLQNLKQYQQLLQPSTRLMAMVKAFSYGSGSYEIASLLQFHGVDYLAVAYTDEGVALRKAGIDMPIMVMNASPSAFDALVEFNLEPVLYSLQLYKRFAAYIRQQAITRYPVHLEMETGMNRLGFAEADITELLQLLVQPWFKIQSVFSHLAASEDPQHDAFTLRQVELFEAATKRIAAVLDHSFLRHIENTAAIFRHPQWQMDMVRLGIGLYGVDPSASSAMRLEEVSTLRTTIAQIKELAAGETVGYGRRGVAARQTRIATVRIGYADGYPRVLGNGRGSMLVGNQLAPVIGSICMDMTMIDITGIEGIEEGDEVIVFGKGLPVAELAAAAGTIPYEIMTGVSQRVKRIYYLD
ncbi:bifunctional UDP-N-acetylmuramoyl-tripeptide:D-alanyl-D-alanine ligase/alanine racemase [Flavihumibacter sediminis]|nr:bifunctional UDP-N-acetylmuramoyl-tripeptide:D-alanyl-D-alanine ligase/alanine racemase [Flavihumibacter sediminis]